ncbi:HAMP domain-containing protein [Paraburkholderia caballeronis]|nr:HAMP domain-containing protein [Paraburkholderia caballeronis]
MSGPMHFPLRLHISVLFAAIVLLVGGLIGTISYQALKRVLETHSSALEREIGRETAAEIRNMVMPAGMAVREIGYNRIVHAGSLRERLADIGALREALSALPAIESVYVGYGNGDFFFLRQLQNDGQRHTLDAPPGTKFVIQSIERGNGAPTGLYIYADADMRPLKRVEHPDYPAQYDPRSRPWYRRAIETNGLVRTPPYAFFSTPEVGMTLARVAPGSDAVVACDINLDTLHDALVAQRSSPGMILALANPDGRLVASDLPASVVATANDGSYRLMHSREAGIPVLARLGDAVLLSSSASASASGPGGLMDVDGSGWYTSVSRLSFDGTEPLYLVSAVPEAEAMSSAQRIRGLGIIATLTVIALSLVATWMMAVRVTKPLEQLGAQADAVRRFEFGATERVSSGISEVYRLGATLEAMRDTIRRLLDTVQTVAAEPEFGRLFSLLLTEMLAEARADAGVLYLADAGLLKPASALTRNHAIGAERLSPLAIAGAAAFIQAAVQDGRAHTGLLSADDIDQAGLRVLQPDSNCHAAAIPLLNRRCELVGVFLLLRSTPMERERLAFITTLTALFVSAIEARELIAAQQNLFDSFVQLIAAAIDAKSPHTGGHCARVPELVKMLAKAACAATAGPYRDFRLGASEWQELHVAAWLHDCGKITTPEYVVEKATKLETIYDRIHEIRMRFEVLKRDEEIRYLKSLAAGADPDAAATRRDAALSQLDGDFAFVAAWNHGDERLDPASADRLRRIGERQWVRTLDDRLGVSRDERQRMDRTPPRPLPAVETLLADKPEHRIARVGPNHVAAGNRWGFNMNAPELLYDRGELHNLLVPTGTLTAEERFKINEHIIQTIVMLSQLPFPRHMLRVPEIAGGHHEKMDGTGYPKGLTRDEMSPLARMVAIADIFEALTAPDRPYKRGKTLSESLGIMAEMKRGDHIDPELFDLFLQSGVYMDYAKRFMSPAQIDDVDIADYLGAEMAAAGQ